MTYSICHVSVRPSRHVVHVDTARRAQIVTRLLAERFPGMTFSMTRGVDLTRGDCTPAFRDSANSFEVRRLADAEVIMEAQANPDGLPKWCAFQYRSGGVCAYRDHDLRAIEMCRRDFDMVQERAIYAEYPTTDEVLDRFRMAECHALADP